MFHLRLLSVAAAHALDLIGERWALLIVRELMLGPKRFTDLRAGLGRISANVLTHRLAELETAGIVIRPRLPEPADARASRAPGSWFTLARMASQNPSTMPTSPLIRLVVAYTDTRVIGRDGGMPWHLPADLAHFKRSTLGHPIVMGRKTWLSLGRPLPGRRNLVLSRDPDFTAPGAECHATLAAALASCEQARIVCVIGGEQIFRLALPLADELIATEIHADLDGDTWFPELPTGHWQEIERLPQPPENGLAYDFVTYRRIPGTKAG